MGLKKVERLEEAPLDFLRGAASTAGQKIGGAARNVAGAVKQSMGDVVQAGRAASAQGDLDKAVSVLAQMIIQYDQFKQENPQDEQRQEQQPEAEAPEQQQEQPEQQHPVAQPERNTGGVANAFRSSNKPRARMGKYGPEMTFNSFVQAVHGDQLNEELMEGMWDFVKGAGAEVGNKVRDSINSYANNGKSHLRDLYRAGKSVSAKADFGRIKERTLQQLALVIQQLKSSLNPQVALQASLQRTVKDPAEAARVSKLVLSNMNKQR